MILNVKKITRGIHLLRTVLRKYIWKFTGMAILGFLAGLSGSVGIGTVIPLFALLTDNTAIGTDIITNTIRNIFSFVHAPFTPSYLILFIVILFVAKGFIQFAAKYFNEKTAAEFEEDIRNDLYKKTLESKWSYLMNIKAGYFERIILFDAQQSSNIIVLLNGFLLLITSLITYALVAFNISSTITLITLGIGVVLFVVLKPFFYKTRKLAGSVGELNREISHYLNEHLVGAKLIKTSGVESSLFNRTAEFFKKLRSTRVKVAAYTNVTGSFIEPLGFMMIAGIFLFSYRDPTFQIAAFAVVVYLVQKMFAFIQSLQGNMHGLSELIPYLETTVRYRTSSATEKEEAQGTLHFIFNDRLVLENISFSYDGTATVLNDVSFTVKHGSVTAIVGLSGAGKSTLADILLRLLQPTNGRITIDGVPITDVAHAEWRSKVAYVPQEVFLLNDTIENNIRYFDPAISHHDIEEAVTKANLEDVISALPQGLRASVGERGLKLSGGQRQRIALARALARHPEILILDEPTSALDTRSEQLIQQTIMNLRPLVTIVIIAHRHSSIMMADQIIVLEDGHISDTPDRYLNNIE